MFLYWKVKKITAFLGPYKVRIKWALITRMSPICINCSLNTSRHRLISLLMMTWGMSFHSCNKACSRSWMLVGGLGRRLTRWSSSSRKCSIRLRSGKNAGHGRISTLFVCRIFEHTLDTWGLALSCCRVRLCRWTIGTTKGARISLRYFSAFIMPWITWSGVYLS